MTNQAWGNCISCKCNSSEGDYKWVKDCGCNIEGAPGSCHHPVHLVHLVHLNVQIGQTISGGQTGLSWEFQGCGLDPIDSGGDSFKTSCRNFCKDKGSTMTNQAWGDCESCKCNSSEGDYSWVKDCGCNIEGAPDVCPPSGKPSLLVKAIIIAILERI